MQLAAPGTGEADRTAGADVGSTLIKLALPADGGAIETVTLPSGDLDAVARRLDAPGLESVGLTGSGAAGLAERLATPHHRADEMEAWAEGARGLVPLERFLLVSVGTGTSAMLVDPEGATRVGGTALGGGTVAGLGRLLTGERDFRALVALAARGDRRRVDLSIGDVYPGGDFPLPAEATASCFARLARGSPAGGARAEDLAHAVMGLVGENVGLICAGLALRHGARDVVFGGSTLKHDSAVGGILRAVCLAFGTQPHLPAEGPYLGALGARTLAGAARPAAERRASR